LAALASVAQAGVVIDLVPQFQGPPQPGQLIPVDVLLSSNQGLIPNIRSFQFDVQDNTPGGQFSNEIFVDPNFPDRWQWDAPMTGPNWFTLDPIPVPRANWILPQPIPGQLIDLTAVPTKVASITVQFNSPGYLDVTNRDDPNPNPIDEGAFFRGGFGPVHDFSVFGSPPLGEVLGGRVFIPEPATLALLALGASTLLRRRRTA
jgi:hypothetical protein